MQYKPFKKTARKIGAFFYAVKTDRKLINSREELDGKLIGPLDKILSNKGKRGILSMATINLRDFYPWYTHDEIVEVPDIVAEELFADRRYHKANRRRVYRNKAQYSMDAGDGIESEAVYTSLTPHEIMERQREFCRLCCALNSLPDTQGRRVEAHYILGKSITYIAKVEGVSKSSVSESIRAGLRSMKKYLQNLF